MPIVLLVRHGQASFGGDDYDRLSDLGRAQSAHVGRELRRRGVRDPLLASGTLARQRDTLALLASAAGFGAPATADPRWNEYDHLDLLRRQAVVEGRGVPADSRGVQALLDRALLAWIDRGDADGWPAFADGVAGALGDTCGALQPGRDAVVVTSAGVLAAVCTRLLGAPPAAVVALNRVMVNAAITTVVVGRSGASLLTVNDHAHLIGADRELLTYR